VYTYGDHKDGNSTESGRLGERAQCETQVAPNVFDPSYGTIAPYTLTSCTWIAELQVGLTVSFFRSETRAAFKSCS
jgi:hypothetical protein